MVASRAVLLGRAIPAMDFPMSFTTFWAALPGKTVPVMDGPTDSAAGQESMVGFRTVLLGRTVAAMDSPAG